MDDLTSLSDAALIDRLQRGAFSYITDYTDAETGLVADTSRPDSPCSIAVVGFALSCYPVAVNNGWMSRPEAAAQTLKTLQSFWSSTQSEQPDATGYKGFYYHFLDMKTRRRVWQCELSLVDTTLLLAGVLMAGCYFDQGGDEAEIRTLADALYRRVDWQWALNAGRTGATLERVPRPSARPAALESLSTRFIGVRIPRESPEFARPRAEEVLTPWLRADSDAFIFSPAEAMEEHRATRRAARRPR